MMQRDSGVGRRRLREFRPTAWSPSSGSCKDVCLVIKKEGSREEVEGLEWKAERESKAQTEKAAGRAYLELDLRSTGGEGGHVQAFSNMAEGAGNGRGQDLEAKKREEF